MLASTVLEAVFHGRRIPEPAANLAELGVIGIRSFFI
jgi:hypothetical protein